MKLCGSWEYDTEGKRQFKLKMVRSDLPNTHDISQIAAALRMSQVKLTEAVERYGGKVETKAFVRQYVFYAVFHDLSGLNQLIDYLEPWELAARMVGE